MMFLLRIIGGWFLIAAVIAFVNDLTVSYQTGAKLSFASLGKDWETFARGSFEFVKAGVESRAHRLWDPVLLSILKAPAFGVFLVVGIVVYAIGLRRRRTDIYAN